MGFLNNESISDVSVTFKAVSQLKYLGDRVNNLGETGDAIKERIQIENRTYLANIGLLKANLSPHVIST